MHLTEIFAFLVSASLANSLPVSHAPCERRVLTTAEVPVRESTTTVVVPTYTYTPLAVPPVPAKPKHKSVPAPKPAKPTPDTVVAPASVGVDGVGGQCAPVSPQHYSGPASNFPRKSEWRPFEELFACNTPSMYAKGNSDEDNHNVYSAIKQVSNSHSIEDRVLLAMIMQESHGDVNTGNAADGQNTPGLMQAMGCPNHAGQAVVTMEEVLEMVRCGATHFQGDGGASLDENTIYVALRSYNSGVNGVNTGDLSNSPSGTSSYVSDVANRLKGWVD